MIGNGNFVAKAKELKAQINFINNVLTGLTHPETTVKIINQTLVYIEYDMASPEYTGRIVFNGDVVSFSNQNTDIEMEKFGYMKWKLDVLRRDLGKKIKTNAKMAARATKHNPLVMALKLRLSERLLGTGGL